MVVTHRMLLPCSREEVKDAYVRTCQHLMSCHMGMYIMSLVSNVTKNIELEVSGPNTYIVYTESSYM